MKATMNALRSFSQLLLLLPPLLPPLLPIMTI